jgi:hypothetical protein
MDQTDEYQLAIAFEAVANLCALGQFSEALIEVKRLASILEEGEKERQGTVDQLLTLAMHSSYSTWHGKQLAHKPND